MTTDNKSPDKKLEALFDAITEDIINMSDEEILSETRSDSKNPEEEANRIRMNVRKTVLSSAPQNFDSVKEFYGSSKLKPLEIPNKKLSLRDNVGICSSPELKMVAGDCESTKIKEQSSLTDTQIQTALDKK